MIKTSTTNGVQDGEQASDDEGNMEASKDGEKPSDDGKKMEASATGYKVR